jgi:hypothetical protein
MMKQGFIISGMLRSGDRRSGGICSDLDRSGMDEGKCYQRNPLLACGTDRDSLRVKVKLCSSVEIEKVLGPL